VREIGCARACGGSATGRSIATTSLEQTQPIYSLDLITRLHTRTHAYTHTHTRTHAHTHTHAHENPTKTMSSHGAGSAPSILSLISPTSPPLKRVQVRVHVGERPFYAEDGIDTGRRAPTQHLEGNQGPCQALLHELEVIKEALNSALTDLIPSTADRGTGICCVCVCICM
jgi:hypothetical protein